MSGFTRTKLEIGETAVTIAGDARHQPRAVNAILSARADIERQIAMDPFFLTTFEPYDRDQAQSDTVRRMCDASEAAGVGPMATVAGAIAQATLEAMVADGCTHGWIDIGGDIALLPDRPVTIEIFSEPGSPRAYALELDSAGEAYGICSSSGRIGHSISLGESDVAVAIADSAIQADAIATALGNSVRRNRELKASFASLKDIEGFIGGMVMLDGAVSICGDVPRIVEVEHNTDRVTHHSTTSKIMMGDQATGITGRATQ